MAGTTDMPAALQFIDSHVWQTEYHLRSGGMLCISSVWNKPVSGFSK